MSIHTRTLLSKRAPLVAFFVIAAAMVLFGTTALAEGADSTGASYSVYSSLDGGQTMGMAHPPTDAVPALMTK